VRAEVALGPVVVAVRVAAVAVVVVADAADVARGY